MHVVHEHIMGCLTVPAVCQSYSSSYQITPLTLRGLLLTVHFLYHTCREKPCLIFNSCMMHCLFHRNTGLLVFVLSDFAIDFSNIRNETDREFAAQQDTKSDHVMTNATGK